MSLEDIPSDASTYFSIYKIDVDKVAEVLFDGEQLPPVEDVVEKLISSIVALIRQRKGPVTSAWRRLEASTYKGLLFSTSNTPIWKDTIEPLMATDTDPDQTLSSDDIYNTTASYVLFHVHNGCIYAMTGGYASGYITKFVERSYGLYLLPKILDREHPSVKHVTEQILTGNRAATHRTNRSPTSFSLEQDLASIYRQLATQIDRDLANQLGVAFSEDESPKKKLNLISRDSLTIRRSITLKDLSRIISHLNSIEQLDDNFHLGYFCPTNKKAIPREDLNNKMVDSLLAGEYDRFVLVGDEYEEYYLDSERYRIYREDGSTFLDTLEPITVERIFTELTTDGTRISRTRIKNILRRWRVETLDNNGNPKLYDRPLFSTMQGFVEYGEANLPCYLISGNWYVFDEVYLGFLDKEFKQVFLDTLKETEDLGEKWSLVREAENETSYIESLEHEERMMIAHKVTLQRVEVADAIFCDGSTVYLMHVKGEFDGIGARDLANQVATSAELLHKILLAEDDTALRKYYHDVCDRLGVAKHPAIDEKSFCDRLRGRNVCFIGGFVKGYRQDCRSTYARHLTVYTYQKLPDKGFRYLPMNVGHKSINT